MTTSILTDGPNNVKVTEPSELINEEQQVARSKASMMNLMMRRYWLVLCLIFLAIYFAAKFEWINLDEEMKNRVEWFALLGTIICAVTSSCLRTLNDIHMLLRMHLTSRRLRDENAIELGSS